MTHPDKLLAQLETWMNHREEDEHLEFKVAKSQFKFRKVVEYCVALANEGGGRLILGVSDGHPRKVLGSRAFEGKLQSTKADLIQELRLRVEAQEIHHTDGRVVVFEIPSRPQGIPLSDNGRFLMRGGEGLIPMTADQLQSIFAESIPDYSAEVIDGLTLADLDGSAIEEFRALWINDSKNLDLHSRSVEQLLSDAHLASDTGVTIAALVLFGTETAVSRHLAQAEVIYEYRARESSIRSQQRVSFRSGFLLVRDALWDNIALRNDVFHFQSGLIRREIRAFDEEVVREALLNAVTHRDYRSPGSVYVRQFPHKLEVESPGGLPAGITRENIVWRREARNRLLAESFERCGLVERSGQGMDIMFKRSIEDGKLPPDFSGTDRHLVRLTLNGQVQDPRFVEMIESISREVREDVSVDDLIALDHMHREIDMPEQVVERRQFLLDNGVIERVGRGRGTRYLLARRFYSHIDEPGVYTRKRGLDRDTNKELLLRHISDNHVAGSRFRDLHQVLPGLSKYQVQTLLRELKGDQRIHSRGVTRAARWYPGPD